ASRRAAAVTLPSTSISPRSGSRRTRRTVRCTSTAAMAAARSPMVTGCWARAGARERSRLRHAVARIQRVKPQLERHKVGLRRLERLDSLLYIIFQIIFEGPIAVMLILVKNVV